MLHINPLKAHSTCFEPARKNVLGIKKIYLNFKISADHSTNYVQVLLAITFFQKLMYIPTINHWATSTHLYGTTQFKKFTISRYTYKTAPDGLTQHQQFRKHLFNTTTYVSGMAPNGYLQKYRWFDAKHSLLIKNKFTILFNVQNFEIHRMKNGRRKSSPNLPSYNHLMQVEIY